MWYFGEGVSHASFLAYRGCHLNIFFARLSHNQFFQSSVIPKDRDHEFSHLVT